MLLSVPNDVLDPAETKVKRLLLLDCKLKAGTQAERFMLLY